MEGVKKSLFTWFDNQRVGIKAAIIGGIFITIAAFIGGIFALAASRGETKVVVLFATTDTPNVTPTIWLPLSSSTSTPTATLSSTSIPTLTESPTPTLTESPTPTKPECINAKVDSLLLHLNTGQRIIKEPDNINHITLTNNETSGLEILTGSAIFKDSKVINNCTCSWKGGTQSYQGSFKDISTKSKNCSFSLPLIGIVKDVYLILSVDRQLISTIVIEFP